MSRIHFASSDLFLGYGENRKPCFINRAIHTQIIGATGTGKTTTGIFPMILDDVRKKRSVVFLDPKGDAEAYETLLRIAKIYGRESDVIRLDLGNLAHSAKYNPLKIGSPSELKDKIIGSIIWTEEFYKKVSEELLLEIFIFLQKAKLNTNLQTVLDIVSNKAGAIAKSVEGKDELTAELNHLLTEAKSQKENLQGLRTDLLLWAKSDFGAWITDPVGSSALDWFMENKIVYINLNTLAFEDTARRFGRLVVQDIKAAVQRIQGMPVPKRPPCGVYIDEFATVATSGFSDLLSKARSANVNFTIAYQSLGDLQKVEPAFVNQVMDNTNMRIIYRIDSPETIDFFARLIGTGKSQKVTRQTNKSAMGGETHTGLGTTRETNEYIVHPDVFRRLRRGQAIVHQAEPVQFTRKVNLNLISRWLDIHEKPEKTWRDLWSSFCELVWA